MEPAFPGRSHVGCAHCISGRATHKMQRRSVRACPAAARAGRLTGGGGYPTASCCRAPALAVVLVLGGSPGGTIQRTAA